MHYTQQKHIKGVTLEDIYIGNGVSELIVMAMNALLNAGDEVLVPAPDYPLWTAAVSLSGGTPRPLSVRRGQRLVARSWTISRQDHAENARHRRHQPEQSDRRALSGRASCSKIIKIAREHNHHLRRRGMTRCCTTAQRIRPSLPVGDVLTVSFNGLSKNYRSCGYRAGWMVVSGDLRDARDYIEGLDMLGLDAPVRQRASQYGIQTALGGYQSIDDLVAPTGGLYRQRDLAHELITAIPGVSCVKPKAALCMFPGSIPNIYPIQERSGVHRRTSA